MNNTFKISITGTILLAALLTLSACAVSTPTGSEPSPAVESTTQTIQADKVVTSQITDQTELSYPIVDTGQVTCYDDASEISCPEESEAYYGQDAQYSGNTPSYTDNGDGTVTDNVTGLIWQQDPGEKMTYQEAVEGAESFELAGYDDWRLPTVKELYSLIQFSGLDPSSNDPNAEGLIPFIDTDYFNFEYGDTSSGERVIDSQWATSTIYGGTVFVNQRAMFGVNFADGRIKGYPIDGGKTFYVIYVRGNTSCGENDFVDHGDGTISDHSTGLTWMQTDSGEGMDWESALNYCETLEYAGSSDWRLPDIKELQSIVDYSRAPDTTGSAAIDQLFGISSITNEAGQLDYPYFWSSTTHANLRGGENADYISFGRAMGYMNGEWIDVHGAGAQRSDAKSGDTSAGSISRGPQGDAVRIENYVRCVTGGESSSTSITSESTSSQQTAAIQPPSSALSALPQAAIDACSGLDVNASCTINAPNGQISGSCTQIQGQTACVPQEGNQPRSNP